MLTREAKIGLGVFGSWFAGCAGAFFFWNWIYGNGGRLIEEAPYAGLHKTVVFWGGVAGVLVGLALPMALRRPAYLRIIGTHLCAVLAGMVGGKFGWREGLWCYFGTFCVSILIAVARRRRKGHRGKYRSHGDDNGGGEGDDGGWFDGGDSGGGDGGGGDGGGGGD